MGGASNTFVLISIVAVGLFFLFVLPKGLNNITTSVISEGGIRFENPSPEGKMQAFGECYPVKLKMDYFKDCTLCNTEDINEYWWVRNSSNSDFQFIKGDRKTLHSQVEYTAETSIDACSGNSYEWYVCVSNEKMSCAGKEKPFKFKAE